MAEPKKKKSKQKVRQRVGQVKAVVASVSACPNCGAPMQSHHACPSCGMYNGRKVLTVKADAEK
ncbi:MAG: 50S ribosomal protein L32 [Kiritimatiellae bacterium]|nr:50S ribosomal protein L32 [Kiritimatiellia bacterium]